MCPQVSNAQLIGEAMKASSLSTKDRLARNINRNRKSCLKDSRQHCRSYNRRNADYQNDVLCCCVPKLVAWNS